MGKAARYGSCCCAGWLVATVAAGDALPCADLAQQGRLESARLCLEERLALHPDDMSSMKLLAAVDLRGGAEQRAAELLENLLVRDPADQGVRNNLAWLLATAKDPTLCRPRRALDLAREALVGSPDDYHVWSTLAECYFAVGEFAKALSAVETALRMAHEQGAPAADLETYREQRARLGRVASAMSLVE